MNTQFKTPATGKVRLKKRLYYEKQTKKGHVPTLFRESEGHGLYKMSLYCYSCTLYVLMLLAAIFLRNY